jgi:hypothetical protein
MLDAIIQCMQASIPLFIHQTKEHISHHKDPHEQEPQQIRERASKHNTRRVGYIKHVWQFISNEHVWQVQENAQHRQRHDIQPSPAFGNNHQLKINNQQNRRVQNLRHIPNISGKPVYV